MAKKAALRRAAPQNRTVTGLGAGNGGEMHQTAPSSGQLLTTNQGGPIADNQNSLKSGPRGPTLLEDFVLREKITHFDHERIPERIVHARGSGAHGYFQPTKSLSRLTRAAFLQSPETEDRSFRALLDSGGRSGIWRPAARRARLCRQILHGGRQLRSRGKQHPGLFHSGRCQISGSHPFGEDGAGSRLSSGGVAHDTFWDFASLMPESMHMLTWVMSDRAIPRSLRMIEGFGIHTFRMVNKKGQSTFVKFHWRPKAGAVSVIWDEAVKINGADPDFHRRDLFEAIEKGDFPEWEFCIQSFDQDTADSFEFDILDPTKLIPEEIVPLEVIGKMVLNRNADNFFAETEQVAFHPGNVVPGIEFTNDPLLQGRLFHIRTPSSYGSAARTSTS